MVALPTTFRLLLMVTILTIWARADRKDNTCAENGGTCVPEDDNSCAHEADYPGCGDNEMCCVSSATFVKREANVCDDMKPPNWCKNKYKGVCLTECPKNRIDTGDCDSAGQCKCCGCKIKKCCKKRHGYCIKKDTGECDGHTNDAWCKGKKCTCCIPKCPQSKDCLAANGRCGENCNHNEEPNHNITCINDNCACCVPRGMNDDQNWDDNSCRMELYGHYFAKGCTPVGTGLCPESFSCPEYKTSSNKCFYRGTAYNLWEQVPIQDDPCAFSCYCAERNITQIECPVVDCPEMFFTGGPNCALVHRRGDCCSELVCGVTTTPSPVGPGDTSPVTCEANNRTYELGDRIYYDEFPCLTCYCTEGFDGPNSRNCDTYNCGFDYRYTSEFSRGCVPIYYHNGCCPIDWLCPDDSHLLPGVTFGPPQVEEDGFCYLGDHKVKRGETLWINNCRIICGCMTPPELTCIQYRDCQSAIENSLFAEYN